jgi:prevent-host-death family protein
MSDRKSATKRAREATTPLTEAPLLPTTVGIRALRDHLSQYLEVVKSGTPVSVTDHGRVVAAIVPMTYSQHMLDLAAKGYVTLPRLPKSATVDWPRVPIEGGTDDLIDWAKGERVP